MKTGFQGRKSHTKNLSAIYTMSKTTLKDFLRVLETFDRF